MKIKQLDLKAFGPFTDRTLKFNSGRPGLHIIFGPNETGKSSALRALKALLYGFPERTPDNFVHANDQLFVGGSLQDEDGREISFLRRKRRKTDIFDLDENPLDEGVLGPFLHGIEQGVFETLYGIDHEVLVRGGRDILAQKGEIGQALFSAGAGISSLREILDSLDAEAGDLFKARGSKQEINRALSEYKKLQKEVREAILPGRQWKEVAEALKRAEEELAAIEQVKKEKDTQRRQLERLKQALPQLALRRDLMARLALLGETALLPVDFAVRRRAAEKALYAAGQKQAIAANRLEALREKQKAISFQQSILDNSELIENLYQRLGSHRKAMEDRPRLEGMRIGCRSEAATLLKQVPTDLTLERMESLRPVLGRRKVIQRLAANHEALEQGMIQVRKQRREINQNLEKTDEALVQLPPVKDVMNLDRAIKLARKSGDIDTMIAEKKNSLEELKRSCLEELDRLGLWSGELARIGSLSIPLRETIIRFDRDFREYEDRKREILKDQKKRRDDLARAAAEVREIEYSGEVPTEEDLAKVRETRERGWQLIRRQWLNGEDVGAESRSYDRELPLSDAYEKQVEQADSIADRLRREADRVHKFAALKADRHALEKAIEDLVEKEKPLDSGFEAVSKAWQEAWQASAIQPLPPKEMLDWLNGFEKIRFKAEEIERVEREISARGVEREKLRSGMLEELKDLGEVREFKGDSLDPVLISCETILDDFRKTKEKREKLIEKREELLGGLEEARNDQQAAEERLEEWQERWKEFAAIPGSSKEILPEEANDILDAIQRCFTKLKESDDLKKRIEGIDRDAKNLAKSVESLFEDTDPELKTHSPEQAVMQLQALLKQTLENKTLLDKYTREIQEAEDEITGASAAIKAAEEQIGGLRRIAGCGKDEDLEAAELAAREYQDIKNQLSETEALLLKSAEGFQIDELEAQTEGVNPDELPGKIESLTREIEQGLDLEIKRLSEYMGEKKKDLQQMDGSAKAADAAEAAQQVLARIRRLADHFIRLKVASKILNQEIERFRAENQDPVLRIASKYFQQLTLSSFESLRTDEDDHGRPVLVGLRPDNSMVRVEGMSSGTRDQLYLALRLASLERRLERSEPMPFIVDDILINFDDDRSKATLEALADLAAKTQVILFTHHSRIREEAEKMGGEGYVTVHEL
ncbi:MAG: AAA family ATPase [Desulfobacteraceae bacterium]|nr:AAA family ATPase [Desulfobacteraceae bacterium]